jgi:hypothetical protein
MRNKTKSLRAALSLSAASVALTMTTGCHSSDSCCSQTTATTVSSPASVVAPAVAAAKPAPVAEVPIAKTALRFNAGASEKFTDSSGNTWLPDKGFDGGDVVERPDLEIANTKDPALYRSEHYSMNSFSTPVPNGKYVVKLHFCETFDGIEGPGQRVFSFNVEGHEFKNFDVWVKAGGPRRAYIETVNVEVTDGKLDIAFTPNVENPQINAIEIIPAS